MEMLMSEQQAHPRSLMYFEEGADAGPHSGEEAYVAAEINAGRRMLTVDYPVPTEEGVLALEPAPAGDRPEIFTDAVGALLLAARFEGLDPEDICASALRDHTSTLEKAVESTASLRARSSGPARPGIATVTELPRQPRSERRPDR
jgi:hypothetical protein